MFDLRSTVLVRRCENDFDVRVRVPGYVRQILESHLVHPVTRVATTEYYRPRSDRASSTSLLVPKTAPSGISCHQRQNRWRWRTWAEVMVDPDADPALIAGQVVHPVRNRLAAVFCPGSHATLTFSGSPLGCHINRPVVTCQFPHQFRSFSSSTDTTGTAVSNSRMRVSTCSVNVFKLKKLRCWTSRRRNSARRSPMACSPWQTVTRVGFKSVDRSRCGPVHSSQ